MKTTFNTELIDSNIENQPYLDPFARGVFIVSSKRPKPI